MPTENGKPIHIPHDIGRLPADWNWYRLDEICQGIFDCPHSTPKLADSGPLMVRTQDILSGVFRKDQAVHVSEDTYAERVRRAEPKHGDLVYSREGTYFGISAEVPPNTPVCLGQRMVLIRPHAETVHFRFLRYWLNSPIMSRHIHGYRDGTVAERLNLPTIRALPIAVPPKHTQEAIAGILGALDDKIELNRRMNKTLEAMARAIFKSWFVDFDPVRAKLDGRQPPGMDAEMDALFPDELEESEVGLIPRGWAVSALEDVVQAQKGLSYKGSGLSEVGFPLHNLNSIYEGGGYKFEGIKHYIGEYKDRHIIHPGDVIVANTEQGHDRLLIGYAAIVARLFGETGLFSHHIYRVLPKKGSPLTPDFLCHLLNSRQMHDTVSGYGNGTTVNMLPQAALESPQITVPPKALIDKFTGLAAAIRERCEQFVRETRTLFATRDALLPKLLSGEIDLTNIMAYSAG